MQTSIREKESETRRAPSRPLERYRSWWQPARLVRHLLLGVLSLVLAIAVLEGFFKIAGVGEQEILLPDPELGCRHIPDKPVTWRFEGFSRDQFTRDGLRDVDHSIAKPPGTIRIALLGDSVTEALQVPLEKTYARRLEQLLNVQAQSVRRQQVGNAPGQQAGNVQEERARRTSAAKKFEVINFGCSSYSTGQELMYFRNAIAKYKPDYVVVMYTRGDSIENVCDPSERSKAEPRPYFYLDGNNQLQMDDSVLQMNNAKLHPPHFLNFLRANSRIFGVLSQTNLSLILNERLYWKLKAPIEKAVSSLSPKPASAANFPVYQPQDKLKVSCALIDRFATEVYTNGGEFVLLLFPDLGTDWEYTAQIHEMKKLSGTKHFSTIDLTSDFTNYSKKKLLFLLFHLSEQGHEVTAKALQHYFSKKDRN